MQILEVNIVVKIVNSVTKKSKIFFFDRTAKPMLCCGEFVCLTADVDVAPLIGLHNVFGQGSSFMTASNCNFKCLKII